MPTAQPTSSPDGVLITRPQPGADATAARVAALGLTPVVAPLLEITIRPILVDSLAGDAPAQAVLVTSGNAIPALPATLHGTRLLAVGDATAALAAEAGFTNVLSAGRDAAALAALAAEHCRPEAGRLLLASGAGQGKDLAADLRTRGFQVVRRVAYEARPVATLPAAARAALTDGSLRAALFFSPETAQTFVTILQHDISPAAVRNIEALAISPNTGQVLAALPWRRVRVAPRPAQTELLGLLTMTEPTPPSEDTTPATAAMPAPGAAPPPSAPQRSARGVLTAFGFLLLVIAGAGLWRQQHELRLRLEQLAAIPPPPAASPAEVADLTARLAVLEQRRPPEIGPLAARIAALEGRKPEPPPDTTGPLVQKLETVAATTATKSDAAALSERLADLDARLKQAEQRQAAFVDRTTAAQRIERALLALDAGDALGDWPGAPPALARFATAKPPTEAALRLSYPAAAAAAAQASDAGAFANSLAERILLRASALVTVKQGDKVLVGQPVESILADAHAQLEAGDLAGAVAGLDKLDPAAAKAMAGWKAQAQALLDARAALAKLVRS